VQVAVLYPAAPAQRPDVGAQLRHLLAERGDVIGEGLRLRGGHGQGVHHLRRRGGHRGGLWADIELPRDLTVPPAPPKNSGCRAVMSGRVEPAVVPLVPSAP
jgi:hypothetical protein